MSSGGEKVCPLCGGTGFIITPRGAKKCRCLYEGFNISKYLNIPKRFWDADIKKVREILDNESFGSLKGYLRDFPAFYEKGVGLLLMGQPGVGKSYIAAAVLKYIYQKYRVRGLFTDTKELSIKLRDNFSEQRDRGNIVEALIKIPVLVLDDLGNEYLTDWYRDILTGIIARRYNDKKVTFITTNYYPSFLAIIKSDTKDSKGGENGGQEIRKPIIEQTGVTMFGQPVKRVILPSDDFLLDKRIGSHIVSRLGEMTLPILIGGSDRRLQKVIV